MLYLRILFERNNKLKSTFDKLGNVFRNSKWSNLKVQNIKTSLINSWFYSASIFTAILLLVFSFFGFTNTQELFSLPAFISELYGLVFFLVAQVFNTISLSLIKLTFLIFTFKIYLINLLKPNSNFVFDSFSTNTKSSYLHPSKLTNVNPTFSTPHLNVEALMLTHSLGKVTYSLGKLNDSKSFKNFFEALVRGGQVDHGFNLLNVLDFGFSEDCSYSPRLVTHNINSYKPGFDFTSKSIQLSLGDLNALQENPLMKSLSNFNIYTNLNHSKQLRWATKNSLLSNTSTSDLFYFTQAKNVIGNTLYNSLNTSQNVWNSSKLTQLFKAGELNNLSFLQNQNLGKFSFYQNSNLNLLKNSPSGLQNLNYFENSKIWNNKKYFFSTQLKSNTHQLYTTNNSLNKPGTATYSNDWKLLTLSNLLNYSLVRQTENLVFSWTSLTESQAQTSLSPITSTYQTLITDGGYDHLKNSNLSLLTSLASSTSSNSLPIYTFVKNPATTTKLSSKLHFKITL